MIYDNTNDIVDELFKALLSRYHYWEQIILFLIQSNLCITNITISFGHGGSYIDSPDWIKKKNATINLNNKDNKYFQYVITVALNYGETESYPK